jgi:geranylgeranyl reductase family protein
MTGENLACDILVIGAGPAGASAAYRLARAGFDVLVVDKADFPRDKPCAGGLTIKTLALLPYSIGPIIEAATRDMAFGRKSAAGLDVRTFPSQDYTCAFVVRRDFDAFNHTKMLEAGARFVCNAELSAISQSEDGVTASFGETNINARYLIGADGANSRVRRLLGGSRPEQGFAVEGLIPRSALSSSPAMEFVFGTSPRGYGWVFPKRDHVNVGLYNSDRSYPLSKAALRDYARERLGTDQVEDIVGFPMGFGARRMRLTQGRVLLSGDAAGTCEPLLGEGLHNAIASGQSAADAIIAHAVHPASSLDALYAERMRPILDDLRRYERLSRFFYDRLDGLGFKLLTSLPSRIAVARGTAAGMSLRAITNGVFAAPFFKAQRPQSLTDFLTLQAE